MSPPSRRLGREGSIDALVAAARELFAEHGPDAGSLRDVARKAWVSAAISTGSPKAVPVPCASMYVTVSASTCAMPSASVITFACPATLGAEKPTLVEPSLLIDEPRITAQM